MKSKVLNSECGISKIGNSGFFKSAVLVIVMIMFGIGTKAADYSIDKNASSVKWVAKKVTGQHNGSISFESGTIAVAKNAISGGSFVINMKSIVNEDITNEDMKKKLIGHLASDDFFSIEKFPDSKMEVKKVTLVSGDDYHFVADLTIKGITNPVEFNANVSIKGDQVNAKGTITVNRTLYGIKYGSGSFIQGLGDRMIYDDFTLDFNIVAKK
jgi:polyisoprenoid-binding protein YceI